MNRPTTNQKVAEAKGLRRRFVDLRVFTELLVFLWATALREDDHVRAVALLEESLVTFQGLGDSRRVTMLCLCYTIWYTSAPHIS